MSRTVPCRNFEGSSASHDSSDAHHSRLLADYMVAVATFATGLVFFAVALRTSSPPFPSCISDALTWHASGAISLRLWPLMEEGLTPPPSGEIMPTLPSEVNYGQSGSHIERRCRYHHL